MKRKKRFIKPILSASAKLKFKILVLRDIHCNGHRQIFSENLSPNLRFGVEIVENYFDIQ